MPIDVSLHVLVVDDFPQMRRIMIKLLKEVGFTRFTEAEDGLAAITKLKLHQEDDKFGLALMDWNMPKMHGIEVVQIMKHASRLKNIPALMVTAEAKAENLQAAAHAGVNKFLVKPFSAAQLKEKIEELFADSTPSSHTLPQEAKPETEDSDSSTKQTSANAQTLTKTPEKKLGRIS